MVVGKANILLVDDDPTSLFVLERVLSRLNDISLVKAMSGEEALAHLEETEFALVILDISMPGINGFDVARQVSGLEKNRHTSFLFCTAIYKEEKDIFAGYDLGAVDYLFKPYDAIILLHKVRVFVNLYRMRKTLELRETELLRKTHDLGERVKELDCLLAVSQLGIEDTINLGSILERIVDILPSAMQYPEIAVARIEFDGQTSSSKGFQETAWSMGRVIQVQGSEPGLMTVSYLQNPEALDEGEVFLEEEYKLLEAVAGHLERVVERNRTHVALGKSEASSSRAQRAANVGTWEYNLRTGSGWWSDQMYRVLGFEPGAVEPGFALLKSRMLPEDIPGVEQLLQPDAQGSGPFEVRFRISGKAGGVRHLSMSGGMEKGPDGDETILYGVLQDITERYKSERALQTREDLLNKMGTMARIGGWELDLRTGLQTWTQETYTIHDLGTDFDPNLESGLSFYAPEHQPVIREAVRCCMEQGQPFDLELELITAKNRRLWVRAMGEPVYESGRIAKVGGTLQDITEHKRIHEQVLQSEETFRSLYESIRDAILVANMDRNIINLNPAFTDLFGYSLEDLAGKKTLGIYEDEAEFLRMGELIRQHGGMDKNFIFIVMYRKKSGKVFPGETNVFKLRNPQGEAIGFIGLIRDISERLKAEEQIMNLARFPAENPHPVLRISRQGELLYANQASAPLRDTLGLQESEPLPETFRLFFEQALQDKALSRHELKAGQYTYAMSILPVEERGYVNIYGMDITERKRAEETVRQHAFELEVLHELAGELGYTLDYEDLLKLLIDNLGMVLDFDMAAGLLLNQNEGILFNYCTRPLDRELHDDILGKMRMVMSRFLGEESLMTVSDLPLIACVVSGQDEPVKHLESFFLVPLFQIHGGVAGVLYVGAEAPDAFTPEQVGMVFKVAEQASGSVARLRTLVEENRQELEQLVDSIPAGVVLLDSENVVVMSNPRGRDKLSLLSGVGIGDILDRLHGFELDTVLGRLRNGEEQLVELPGPPHRIIRVSGQQLLTGPQAGGHVLVLVDVTREQEDAERLKASERRFRTLFDNSSDAILVLDLEGRVLDVNEVACKRLVYSREELVTMQYLDLVTPELDDAERLHGILQELQEKDRIVFETAHLTKEGGSVPTEINAKRIVFHGQSMILVTARDITERKRAEQERIEHEAMLDSILSGIKASFFIVDSHSMKVVEVNEQAARMLGLKREEMLDHLCHEFLKVPGCEFPSCENCTIHNLPVLGEDSTLILPEGKVIPVSLNRLRVMKGGQEYVAIIVFDTTERKALERQLAFAQKLESMGQLAAGIAHEINTPIQYVAGNISFFQTSFEKLRVLLDKYESFYKAVEKHIPTDDLVAEIVQVLKKVKLEFLLEEIPQAIKDSHDGVERVASIVQAMKKFSHPDVDDLKSLDVNEAIENTLVVARNEWKYDSEMITEFDKDLPPILCKPGDFNQAILNVVVNAAHANSAKASDGGGKGTISISTMRSGDFVEIRIADTGTGIAPENCNRIFDPFFTTKEVGKGTGQGLAITHSIVTKHGGAIDFETTPGQGTTFTLRFPLDPAKVREVS